MDNSIPQDVATNVAWAATLLCTVATIYCANTWGKSSPRIFAALAAFAISWALLLPYYSVSKGNEILSAFQGLLLVLTGGPLRREGAIRKKHARHFKIASFDRWGLSLLLFLIFPHFVLLPSNPTLLLKYLPAIDVSIGTALTLIGFYSVGDGIRSITSGKKWIWSAAAFALYGLLEFSYAVNYWGRYLQLDTPSEFAELPMPSGFKWAFAVAKCVATSLFLWLVVRAVKPHSQAEAAA